jgi:FixJ family two-component response regulator
MKLLHEGPTRGCAIDPGMPVVYVVDADADVRRTLEELVRTAGFRACTAASGEEFLALPRPRTACCLVLEERLPGLSGLELQRRVQDRTEMPVIFITRVVRVEATVQAMKAGAIDFFAKPLVPEVLVHTIDFAINCSRATLHREEHRRALQQRYESLSRREREVMKLVVAGRLNKQVGGELGITEITVKAHRGQVMRKMQAGSVAELVSMAVRLRNEETGEFSV